MKLKVLVVDDQPTWQDNIKRVVERLGHEVILAAGGDVARKLLRIDTFDAVITDTRMPGGSGWELLQWMSRVMVSAPPTLIHSGDIDIKFWLRGTVPINLETDVPKCFGHFARFRDKGTVVSDYIELFLNEVKP